MVSITYVGEEDTIFKAFGQLLIANQGNYGLEGRFVWTKDGYFYKPKNTNPKEPEIRITTSTRISHLGLDEIDFKDILRGFEDEFDELDLRPYPVFQRGEGDFDKPLVSTVGELVRYIAKRKSVSQGQKQGSGQV